MKLVGDLEKVTILTWVFPKMGGYPQNGWFIMENPIKLDDLGGPALFVETPICGSLTQHPSIAPSKSTVETVITGFQPLQPYHFSQGIGKDVPRAQRTLVGNPGI